MLPSPGAYGALAWRGRHPAAPPRGTSSLSKQAPSTGRHTSDKPFVSRPGGNSTCRRVNWVTEVSRSCRSVTARRWPAFLQVVKGNVGIRGVVLATLSSGPASHRNCLSCPALLARPGSNDVRGAARLSVKDIVFRMSLEQRPLLLLLHMLRPELKPRKPRKAARRRPSFTARPRHLRKVSRVLPTRWLMH